MNTSTRHRRQATGPRRRVCIACLLGLCLLASMAILYGWLIQRLPAMAVEQLGKLTQTEVRVKSIRLSLSGAVHIEDLLVLPASEPLRGGSILKAETVQVDFSPTSLFLLKPKLKNVLIRDFLLDIQLDLDKGLWNVGDMTLNIPKGQGSGQMPSVELQNGAVRYSKVTSGRIDVVASLPVEAFFEFNEMTEKGYRFQIMTAGIYDTLGQSTLNGYWKPGRVTLTGGISSLDAPSMERAWSIGAMAAQLDYDQDRDYTFSTRIRNFQSRQRSRPGSPGIAATAWEKAPAFISAARAFIDRYRPSGTVDIEFTSEGNLKTLAQSRFQGRILCLDVSILDKRFPYYVDRLSGSIRFDNHRLMAEQLSGMHQDTPIDISFSRDTSVEPAHYQLRVYSEDMALDQDLYRALSERHKRSWDRVNLQGRAQIEYKRSRNAAEHHQVLSARLKDARVTYTGFPYPLKQLNGEVVFTPEKTEFSHLISRFGDRRIFVDGRILTQPRPDRCRLAIRADNIPLNTTLANALPLSLKKAYEQLRLSGRADAVVDVVSDPNDPNQVVTTSDLTLHQATLHILDKQLPLQNSEGSLTLAAGSVQIHKLKGIFFGSPLTIQGSMTLDDRTSPQAYDLVIDSPELTMEGLTAALPERPVSIIQRFEPKGTIGLNSSLRLSHGSDSLRYRATVDCNGLTIVPKLFPYPLHTYSGQLLIDNNRIQLDNVLALPAGQASSPHAAQNAGLRINGNLSLSEGRLQAGQLTLSGQGLILDPALGQAMPASLSELYQSLAPTGQMKIDPTAVLLTTTPDGIIHVDYWATSHLMDCQFKTLGTSAEISGSIAATGHYDTQKGLEGGVISVSADRFSVNHKTATNLTALLRYMPEKRTWESDDLLADFYEGKIAGEMSLGADLGRHSESRIQLAVTDANLHQFLLATDTAAPKEIHTSVGTMNGYLSIVNPLASEISRIGRCLFSISHMQVGKVSPLFKLLSALQLAEPSDYIFENMLIDSYMQDDQLYIEKFDLSGESLALKGRGTLRWPDNRLQLTLLARGKRLVTSEPSVLQSLTEGLVGTVMRVDVSGTLQDPVVIRKVPMIEDSLKLLGTPTQ